MVQYKLVIFDCDGTLVDTVCDVALCFSAALEECGFPRCDLDAVVPFIGLPLEEIARGLLAMGGSEFSDTDVEKVSLAYKRHYAASDLSNTAPFPGVVELLDELVANGVAIGVNSNKPESALIELLGNCFPGSHLDIVGFVPGRPSKPNPNGAVSIVERANVAMRDAVYVGDTVVDLDTAINAQMDCILVAWGQGGPDLRERPELVAYCDTPQELLSCLLG